MPEVLTEGVKPVAFSLWKDNILAWAKEGSGGRRVPTSTLLPYVKQCIDQFWLHCIQDQFSEELSLEENLNIIRDELLILYPILKRRQDVFRRRQANDESASDYIRSMTNLAREAEFDKMSSEELQCHISYVNMTQDQTLKKELTRDKKKWTMMGFKEVIDKHEEMNLLTAEGEGEKKKQAARQMKSQSRESSRDSSRKSGCNRCGKEGHWHLDSNDTPRLYLKARKKLQSRKGHSFDSTWVPDTGATMSVGPLKVIKKWGFKINTQEAKLYKLSNASDHLMDIVGTCVIYTRHPNANRSIRIKVLVTRDLPGSQFLMGWEDLVRMGVIPEDFPNVITANRSQAVKFGGEEECPEEEYMDNSDDETEMEEEDVEVEEKNNRENESEENKIFAEIKRKILEEFEDAFEDKLAGSKTTGEPISIKLNSNKDLVTPKNTKFCRPVDVYLKDAADEVIETLIKEGVIREKKEATTWCSRGCFVKKGDTGRH